MRDTFESQQGYGDDLEIGLDNFEFKSAGKKYINQNYKRIGAILGVEGEGLGVIKKQANRENKLPDIQGDPSLEQINFYRGHYYFSPLTPDEYAAIKAQNISEEAKGEEVAEEELPVVEALREESDSLINESIQQHNSTEEGGKLARIEGEIHPGEGELETLDKSAEIEQLKQEARQAIQRYKEFGDRHAPNLRTEYVQDIYRQLEKVAWDKVEELSHKLDGHLSGKLPQLRDILTAHRDLTNISDAKNYLLQKGNILVNDEGTITHIVNYEYKGDEVELNHPKTFGEIFNQSRPVRILYRTNKEGKKIGYIIKGLNLNTPDWIEGVLSDKEYLEPVIVDETGQPAAPITEADAPPENNLGASAENLDILESYRQQGFNEAQLAFIQKCIDVGDTTDQIALYAKPEYEVAQMIVEREKKLDQNLDISQYEGLPYWQQTWIITGIRAGHTPDKIALYAKEGISSDEIAGIQSDIQNGLTIEQINEKQIKKRAEVYLNGDGFSRDKLIRQLESEGLTNEQVTQAIDSMDIDWNQEAVKSAKIYLRSREALKEVYKDKANWSKNELIHQLEFAKFTNEQARFAVDNISDYEWKEDAEVDEPEQAEGGETTPVDHPDRGSLYYQEIQLWNNIQALENRQKENPKDTSIKSELDQAKQAYQEFRSAISDSTEQDKFKKFLELRESYAQAESENTRGRFWKLLGLKKKNKTELETIRSQYNEALEALLKTETSIGVEGKIKEMFSDEVQRLSGERVVQTKELQEKNQSGFDRAINPLKDRIFNWYVKNKSAVGAVNLGLFATSTLLAFTGAGIPLAGAVNTLRHTIAYPMAVASGISSRELIRSKFEDENTNLNLNKKIFKFNLKTNFEFLKFKGGITKLVDKSLQNNYIQNASNEDLSKLVSTLESYYGLNGGNFTELNQQKAYEMGLNELGARLERANNQSTDEQDMSSESSAFDNLDYKFDFRNTKDFKIKTVDGLITRISQDRISALNAQKNKRLVANVAGTALGGSLLFNLVAQDLQLNKPSLGDSASTTGGSTPDTQGPGAGSGGAGAPETGGGISTETTPPPAPELPPPTGTGAAAEEVLRQARAAEAAVAAAEQAQELAQDVSSLDSGETIWGEITKQLGENVSEAQIQQAVENYLQSQAGQESIFELAQQTEGGRELLSQWGIDNAGEMAGLSKEQLYEVSKYLGEGKLDGLTELSLDNLDALSPAEYVESSPVVEPTIEPGSTEPPAASSLEAQVETSYSELQPVETTEFNRSLSEALGATNLTEAQLQEIIHSFATSEQGSVDLYNQIISNEEGARFLSGFGVNNPADFTKLTQDQIYEIAQTIGVENLDKLPGFELNEIILSKFKDAPDMVELARGTRPLDVVQRYIANELGNLPYDANLGKQVLDTYLQTDAGKQWLYDAIVSNPNPNNQNVQLFREYLRFKGITSSEEFVNNFNWVEFSGNRNIPTSGFWNQIRLPNGGTKLQPLSTFLQPSQMPGIKEAVRQVLTRQLNN